MSDTQTTIGAGVLTAEELVEELKGKLSRGSVYAGLANGRVPSFRVGRKYLISRARVEALFNGQNESEAA